MRSRRARLRAVAIVALVTIASAAQASFIVTQNPANTSPVPLSTATRILVSLRNPMATPQTITMIARSPAGNTTCPASVQIMPADGIFIPYQLPAYSQTQFIIFSNGFSSGDPMPATCVWDVFSSDFGIQQFTTVFDIVPSSTVNWDVQPRLIDFGSQSETNDSETQKILINNFLMGVSTFTEMVIDDPSGSIRFISDCPGQQTCAGAFDVVGKTARLVEIACDPTSALTINATFTIYAASASLGSASVNCAGTSGGGGSMIDIIPAMVDLVGPAGFPTSMGVMITSNPSGDTMPGATITGPDALFFMFINNPQCSGQSCVFGTPGASLDTSLEIQCSPTFTPRTATLTVYGANGGADTDTVMVTCSTSGGGGGIDIVPAMIDLQGTQGLGQMTAVVVTSNPQPNAVDYAEITGPDASSFTIITACGGQICPYSPGLPTNATLSIACTPDGTLRTAQLLVRGPANDTDTAPLRCITTGGGIDIIPTIIDIVGTRGVIASMPIMVTSNPQPNEVAFAAITGADGGMFRITTGGCNSNTCSFPSGTQPTDAVITIECTPESVIRTGQLQVSDPSLDMDTAVVRCIPTGGTPSQSVDPPSYDAMTVAVGDTAGPFPVTITNTSTSGTLITMAMVSDGINWSVDDCTASCTIPPMTPHIVNVTFHPQTPGPHNAVLTVDGGAAGMGTVSLFGIGGAPTQQLDVEVPSSFQLAFGPLARNELSTQSVTLRATGPSGFMVTLTDPGGVYTLSQQSVTLAANGTAMFDVSCQSPTPSGPNAATITISAFPTPTAQNTTTIGLTCTIQDTDVQVTPTMFPFNEVRVGTAQRTLPFTIHNGGGDVMIDFVRVAPARPGLSVTSIPAQQLTSGNDLTGDVIVSSAQEVDLTGAFLEIGISGEPTRQLPITGRVVRPEASVTPSSLDLGTVCVGTQIGGQVTMSNSGTATLRVERPMMDQTSFTANATPPDVYPLDLAPGAEATITISPSTSAMGVVANALMWSVDAPGSPFRVPVSMTYVTTGGAVSPSLVAFPTLDVFGTSSDRKVTLQNCSDIELPLTIEGVVATSGDASAWTVAPRTLQRTLGPKEIVEVIVRFTPKTPGEHHARLVIEIGGEDRSILLEGFADGERRDGLSFYACSCSGPGAPSRGWPIVLALALILRRRRR